MPPRVFRRRSFELSSNGIEMRLGMAREPGALGDVLAQQPVGGLVRSSWGLMVRLWIKMPGAANIG
jgi:hypothetical protein